MAIQWGNNSALAGFQNALALGADIGGAIRQKREDGALSAYMDTANTGGIVATPEQEAASKAAYERLNKINPRLAFQVQGQMQQQEAARAKIAQEQRAAQLRQQAAQGDPAALQQLVGIDFDSWKTLDANKKQQIKAQTEYTGQAALRISQLPPQEQAAAWDQAIEQGVQQGYTGLADYRGKFSPQALNAAIDNAGLVEKYISYAEPKYMVRPTESDLINVRDPNALRAAGVVGGYSGAAKPASKAEYDALAPGTQYIAPDGSVKRKGGGSGNATGSFPATGIGG